MSYQFLVTVEVERESGKFAPRDEIVDQIIEALEGADPSSISGVGADGDSEYSVIGWDVSEQDGKR